MNGTKIRRNEPGTAMGGPVDFCEEMRSGKTGGLGKKILHRETPG
ncbi:hypothetical protein [Streptomyces montanisoli]|nr:hypothetical protein [Streptomyces montanisoli]